MPQLAQSGPSSNGSDATPANLTLKCQITDPIIVAYLLRFADEDWPTKAIDAMKVGVIAIENASPSLDTRVVEEQFAEVEDRLKEHVSDFQKDLSDNLDQFFKAGDGVIPKRLEEIFGERGIVRGTLTTYFDPSDGRLSRLLEQRLGPSSEFGKMLDPNNKKGLIAAIEMKVNELVEAKLDPVLKELTLDGDESAMSRLRNMLEQFFGRLSRELGIQDGKSSEAQRGHAKGLDFESDLYQRVAAWGRELGDETDFVRGTPGVLKRKLGDHLVTLGKATGAPGRKIVIEAKDQPLKLRDAIRELQEAKENRAADCGIFVFAKGCEPPEIGDFLKVGEDFYCTADKNCLDDHGPLPFIEAAIKIARVQSVLAVRREQEGTLDLDRIEQNISAAFAWLDRLSEMTTKARTIQSSGQFIEKTAIEMKADLDERLRDTQRLLKSSNLQT
jgi:hypothetical protein